MVNGTIVAGFDLFEKIENKYNFLFKESKEEIENAIKDNLYFFDIEESSQFYWPDNRMFGHHFEIRDIKGKIFRLKKEYQVAFR